MTSPAISLPQAPESKQAAPVVVRFGKLLALYAIVPFCILAVLVDLLFFHGALRAKLPGHPDQLFLFTVFFNFPHIVASHVILLDREYLKTYGKRVLLVLAFLMSLTLVLGAFIGLVGLAVVAVVVTNYHIIGQQIGLTGAQLRTSHWTFSAWRWLSQITAGILLFTLTNRTPESLAFRPITFAFCLLLLIPSTLCVASLAKRSATRDGRRYVWANQLMFITMAVTFVLGYPLFAALMTRVVHDVSAFYVYSVHDTNRNQGEEQPNVLYRALSIFGIPPYITCPILAIGLGFLLERCLPALVSLNIVYWLSGLHYYLESFVWKTGTLHRRFTSFR